MNAVVIGLGSMGKRRIRLLNEFVTIENVYGVDKRKDRREEAEKLYQIETFETLADGISVHRDIDCAIVSTAPLTHSKIISECLSYGLHVFTELNLIQDGYEENIRAAREKELTLFLSSTMQYRNEIEWIKHSIRQQVLPVNYIYHVGQYLPTWHPWESYQEFFVGDRRTNGCREIFAIELPWLIDVFGEILEISGTRGNMTTLDIEYPDYHIVQVKHQSGAVGVLNFNIVSERAVRNLEIYGQGLYLIWKGTPDSLCIYDSAADEMNTIALCDDFTVKNKQNRTIVEDAYKKELIEFFDVVSGKKAPRYSFEKDIMVLDLIDRLEQETR